MSNILGANGATFVALGGERSWLQRVKGDMVVSYEWLMAGGKEPEACMVIFPAAPKYDAGAYAITQASAHEYATRKGDPTEHLMKAAMKALVTLGYLHTDKAAWSNIITIVLEGLPDLIRMPSDQPASLDIKRRVIGIEATAKVGGSVIHQEVL